MIYNLALTTIALAITLIVLEIGFRFYFYYRYVELSKKADIGGLSWTLDKPIFVAQQKFGYSHVPNQVAKIRVVDRKGNVKLATEVHTNRFGMVSRRPKRTTPTGTIYKIAVIGDSMTASYYNNFPWPDDLERLLNDMEALKQKLRVDHFSVFNFGQGSSGVQQFDMVSKEWTARFEPDLVIVNLITDDVFRKPVWRGTIHVDFGEAKRNVILQCGRPPVALDNPYCTFPGWFVADPQRIAEVGYLTRLERERRRYAIDKLNWFKADFEVVRWSARQLGFDVAPSLSIRYVGQPRFANWSEAVAESAKALKNISERSKRLLVVHVPGIEHIADLQTKSLRKWRRSHPMLELERISGVQIHFAREYFSEPANFRAVVSWFNLPVDRHFSDEGARRHAAAVAKLVAVQLSLK